MLMDLFSMMSAYLIGSISSAILVSRLMKLPDPRLSGSHNPGATNVLRVGNKKAAALTLLGDMLKGFLPLFIAKYLGFNYPLLALMGLAACLGHLWPIFFAFKGGKGVATAIGVYFALSPLAGFYLMITWLLVAILFRFSSLASLVMAIAAPIYITYFIENTLVSLIMVLLSALLIYKHKQNIINLIQGKENQIGKRVQSLNGKRG